MNSINENSIEYIAIEELQKLDWDYVHGDNILQQSARAKLMVIVRRTLTKFGYPPDKQQKAVETVLQQAELFADELTRN